MAPGLKAKNLSILLHSDCGHITFHKLMLIKNGLWFISSPYYSSLARSDNFCPMNIMIFRENNISMCYSFHFLLWRWTDLPYTNTTLCITQCCRFVTATAIALWGWAKRLQQGWLGPLFSWCGSGFGPVVLAWVRLGLLEIYTG